MFSEFDLSRRRQTAHLRQRGISLLELTIVVFIVMVVAGFALPNIISSMHTSKMRGGVSDFSSLIESQRLYAIKNNQYYSLRVLAGYGSRPAQAYVDMMSTSQVATSGGDGGTGVVSGDPGKTGDPVIEIPVEVSQQAAANAPNTSNLQNQLMPANTTVTPTDASVTPITFGPRGLPCIRLTVTPGIVCDSSGGPVAYWTFFQNTASSEWDALTVTPAGRIQRWYYTGSQWNKF